MWLKTKTLHMHGWFNSKLIGWKDAWNSNIWLGHFCPIVLGTGGYAWNLENANCKGYVNDHMFGPITRPLE
jgi:hypothetical protein